MTAALIAAVLAVLAPAAPPAAGARVGSLEIPAIGLRAEVRQGTSAKVLARGPGHYPTTSLPGRGGTIGIAGHRVTNTRPFLRLNRLRSGDAVVLVTPGRRIVYRVRAMRIVPPTQVWPLRPAHVETVVLTACHPPRSDLLRLVVFAVRQPPMRAAF